MLAEAKGRAGDGLIVDMSAPALVGSSESVDAAPTNTSSPGVGHDRIAVLRLPCIVLHPEQWDEATTIIGLWRPILVMPFVSARTSDPRLVFDQVCSYLHRYRLWTSHVHPNELQVMQPGWVDAPDFETYLLALPTSS